LQTPKPRLMLAKLSGESQTFRYSMGQREMLAGTPGFHARHAVGSASVSCLRLRARGSSTRPDCQEHRTFPEPDRKRRCDSLCSLDCEKKTHLKLRYLLFFTIVSYHV